MNSSPNLDAFVSRLEKLETQNRKFKLVSIVLALGLGLLLLLQAYELSVPATRPFA
jgi:hypothetical protein